MFGIASQANTLKKLLNYHFEKKNIDPISIGIGADWGRALMIKAGYSGSGINEVIYMGDVVNRAAHLAHEAGRGWQDPIFVGSNFQGNLNDHNQGLLTSRYVQTALSLSEVDCTGDLRFLGCLHAGVSLRRVRTPVHERCAVVP